MRAIAITGALFAIYVLVGTTALAQDPDKPKQKYQAVQKQVATTGTKVVKVRPPPLVLPNISKMTKKLLAAERPSVQKQLVKSQQVLAFWENRGRWLRAPRREKCWEVPWQRSCTIARASHRLHLTLASAAQEKLARWLPETNDWRTAVRIAQRVFPNTERWLLSCSASEGGWGGFVMNHEGSGVGGNMQMYPSTFWRMWGAGTYVGAIDYMAEKGFVWPESAASWYSPLGQALASAWGLTHGRRGEWHGAGC